MSTIDEARPSAEDLQQRLDFETLVSDLSSRFINLRPGEVDREIEGALRRVCEPLGIDLAVLWQWSDLAPGVAHGHPCLRPRGRTSLPDRCTRHNIPGTRGNMLAGRTVALSSLEALPAEAAVDRESCPLIGIKSNLALPLAVGVNRPLEFWVSIPCTPSATGRTRW